MSAHPEDRIVVGVDGSAEADAALDFALAEAQLRGLPLRVVCAWQLPTSAFLGEAFAATPDAFLEAEHHAEDVLRQALERAQADEVTLEAVPVEAVSVEGHATTVLVEQAAGARLLVVGSRGRGAAKSLLLGSVSRHLAHHAPCPVAIVPLR